MCSHFDHDEPVRNNINIPVIYFNGESYPLKNYNQSRAILHMSTVFSESSRPGFIWIPYVAMTPWDKQILNSEYRYRESLQQRPYYLAYCSSNSLPHRENIYRILQKINPRSSHSYGKCQNNRPRIKGSWTKMIKVYKTYRFVLAVENSQSDGYITEKILTAFAAGAIPIYWGDRSIEHLFNVRAFVNLHRFKNIMEAAGYIASLEANPIQQQKIRQEPIFTNQTPPDYMLLDSDFYRRIADKIKHRLC